MSGRVFASDMTSSCWERHKDVGLDVCLGESQHEVDAAHFPSEYETEDEDKADCGPRHNRREGIPVSVTLDLPVAAGAQSSFPFDNVADWVPFMSHRPDHGDGSTAAGNAAEVNDVPMATPCVIGEFFLHGGDELVGIGLE